MGAATGPCAFTFQARVNERACAIVAPRARALRTIRPLFCKGGRRECRVMASPMARLQQKKQAAVTTGKAGSTGIPCAMVLTVSFAISPGTGLSCSRRLRDAKHHRKLGLSVGRPGPRDFAVRIGHVRLTCPPRPPHPRPTVRDDRPKRPLCPQNLPECANGRFSQNRPSLELSP
jgi:hypothetical protein